MKYFTNLSIYLTAIILLLQFQESYAGTKYIEPKKEFLSSTMLARPGIDDLGGVTVDIFTILVSKAVMDNGKSPQLKGWLKTNDGYAMEVLANQPYKLEFVWTGGNTSILKPVNMGGAGSAPALMYIRLIFSALPKD